MPKFVGCLLQNSYFSQVHSFNSRVRGMSLQTMLYQFRVYNLVSFICHKMITRHVQLPCITTQSYYITDYIHCAIHYISEAYLFCNWRSVFLNLFHLFAHLNPPPLWQPSVCSLYLQICFCLLCLLIKKKIPHINEII